MTRSQVLKTESRFDTSIHLTWNAYSLGLWLGLGLVLCLC